VKGTPSEVLTEATSEPLMTEVFTKLKQHYRFHTFYHPYVPAFVSELNRHGVDGLLQRRVQTHPEEFAPPAEPPQPIDFGNTYGPTPIVEGKYPKEDVDFGEGAENGAYAQYNWELFFHAPLLIADRLSKNQRYEDALRWFHFIFDPTDMSGEAAPKRFWRTKPFFIREQDGYRREQIQYILKLLAAGADPQAKAKLDQDELSDLATFEDSVARWAKDPFKPHLVARLRTTAYQKTVVMKYLDTLIAWGDQLFRRDTIESINEATQLYVLAAEILGRRPQEIPPRARSRVQTYNTLEPYLDVLGNSLVQIEDFISPSAPPIAAPLEAPQLTLPGMLYFCVPKNEKLLSYWDTVADRLFKIRHCMTIEGVVRQLPLFEPPIEPGLLVAAAAAGVDIGSILNDVSAALPHYRFSVLVQKATELSAELKALGSVVLAALEKRDGEQLALLRARHETALLELVEQVRQQQVDEANQNLTALRASREVPVARWLHMQKLLGVQSPQAPTEGQVFADVAPSPQAQMGDEDGIKMIPKEREELDQLADAQDDSDRASWAELTANLVHAIPDFDVATKPFGLGVSVKTGGTAFGMAASAFANRYRADATEESHEASKAFRLAGYVMRGHDYVLQSNQTAKEIMQIDKQILAGDLRVKIAENERENHRVQIDNARAVEEQLRDKYTNQELYGWMLGQLATVYFQTYQLAYDIARKSERAFRHELGLKDSGFIQFGYWDSLKKGLLAGERLSQDLKRMELAYLDQHRREFEITKHISVSQLDPLALVSLRQTGACMVSLPEALFDLDYPGQYMRRIKTVGVTIPCVTGPYTGISCSLSLLKSTVRHSETLLGGKKYTREEEDPRFTDSLGAVESIVTSSGQNDSGLFEPNLRDERYLPFEGAGVISNWRIELPSTFRQFDYDTISDVILHVRYTARAGGGLLAQQATNELQAALNDLVRTAGETGLARLFSARHELPNAWYQFLNPAGTDDIQTLSLPLEVERFPFIFKDRRLTISALELFLKVKPAFKATHNESTVKFVLEAGDTAPTPTSAQPQDILAVIPWQGMLRAGKTFDDPPGTWTLNAWLNDGGRLDAAAIEELIIICSYSVAG
jgi:Tc toxin complex TcA C-terminal TcB-binding domain